MKGVLNILDFIFNHPLTRNHRISAIKRFLSWQFVSRFHSHPLVYPFVEDSKLIVEHGMTGATGNIYTGLHEFAEMGLLLHLLRPGDLFGDIGANIGSYTILASAVAKSDSVSVEPVLNTLIHLKNNIAVNNIESRVRLLHCGVGSENGKLFFTNSEDTVNHVIPGSDIPANGTEEVEIRTLDEIFLETPPVLLKIDVEGFEMAVLRGGEKILSNRELKAIIIELNGLCNRYGVKEEDIHQLLLSNGFNTMTYDPMKRELKRSPAFNTAGNTIYIREEGWIRERIRTSRKITVLAHQL